MTLKINTIYNAITITFYKKYTIYSAECNPTKSICYNTIQIQQVVSVVLHNSNGTTLHIRHIGSCHHTPPKQIDAQQTKIELLTSTNIVQRSAFRYKKLGSLS